MNDVRASHPAPDRLAAFGVGQLDDAESAEIERHVAECDSCRRALESVPDDTLVSLLRSSASTASSEAGSDTGNFSEEAGAGLDSLSASGTSQVPDALSDHPRYRVLHLLGAGGMGVVYKAEHKLMKRPVALKVIGRHLTEKPGTVARFRREVEAAARLSHPNIVAAHDAEEVGGTHFLVMEFVEGTTLAKLVAERGVLPVAEACDRVRQAALGLQHAFERDMVHRDIKPQNLIVTRDGQLKILDFGLARFASEIGAAGALTETGSVLGTPDYIAPEQARDAHTADIRADIYSLGCTLYHLLAGHAPYPEGTFVQKLMSHIERTAKPLSELRREVPSQLAAVIARMMAKNPADRFQTPAEVATALDDVSRSLECTREPVQAARGPSLATSDTASSVAEPGAAPTRQPSHYGRLIAAAAAVLLLALGITVGPQIVRIALNKGQIVIETDDPNIEVTIKEGGATLLDRTSGRTITLAAGAHQLEVTVKLPGEDAITFKTDRFTLKRGGKEMVNVRLELAKLATPPTGVPATVAKSSPLDHLDRTAIPAEQLFDWQPKELVAVLGSHQGSHWGVARAVAFSPDGKLVATGGDDKFVRLWDVATTREMATIEHTGEVQAVAFSVDGTTLAFGGSLGAARVAVRVFEMTGQAPRELAGILADHHGPITALAIAPDRKLLSVGKEDGAVELWDLSGGEPKRRSELKEHKQTVLTLAFSPDGTVLASGSSDKTVRIWGLTDATLVPRHALTAHTDIVYSVAFAPNGKTLATGSNDGTVRLWDLTGTEPTERARIKAGPLLAFAPDGKMLACSAGPVVKLFDLEGVEPRERAAFRADCHAITAISFGPKGRTLAVVGSAVRIWDVAGNEPKELTAFNPEKYHGRTLALTSDAKTLASVNWNGSVQLWDLNAPQPIPQSVLKGNLNPFYSSVVISPDGKALATGTDDVRLWYLSGSEPTEKVVSTGHTTNITSLAFSPDGKTLASAGDTTVRLWDRTGKRSREPIVLPITAEVVTSMAFGPDGKALACGSSNGTILLWDLTETEPRLSRTIDAFRQQVYALAFAADGKTLAACSVGAVRFWDLTGPTPKQWDTPADDLNVIRSVAFAPNGKTLAFAGDLGRLVLSDVASGKRIREWQFPGLIWNVAFASDGRHLITANGNGTIYILRLDAEFETSESTDRRLDESVVFSNDFEKGSDRSMWSHRKIDRTPSGRHFLGQFCNDQVRLKLAKLPAHTEVKISFDLYVVNSWDGNSDPDVWDLRVENGPTLVHTTYTTFRDEPQAYPGNHFGAANPPRTGAIENNTLGYFFDDPNAGRFAADSVYHFTFSVPHTEESVEFVFSGSGLQGLVDESWGLDNVEVRVESRP